MAETRALTKAKRAQLPARLEDLARFVLINREKLVAMRAEIRVIDKLDLASGVREQKKAEAQDLAEALLDAEVRIGELTREIPINPGNEKKQTGTDAPLPTKAEVTGRLGLEETQVKRFESLSYHPAIVERVKAETRESDRLPTRAEVLHRIKEAKSEEVAATRKAAPVPAGKYRVLYADPPWLYATEQHSRKEQDTVLASHYPSLSTPDICALPIRDMALDDAALFLWVTSPKLFEAKDVLDAWGFSYKASIVWDKVKHNVGHYVSVRHEFLLIATRGSCLPDSRELHDSVVSIERTEHSVKPPYFRDLIDKMYFPNKRDRIELFARGDLPEWWARWGNE